MHDVPAAHIFGLIVLIAAGGCGSGRPTVPPPAASPARILSSVPPAASSDPVDKAEEVTPHPIPGFRRPFDAPLRAPAVATGDPELDPLVAYLKTSFSGAIKDGRRLVITLSTGARLLEPRQTYQDLTDDLMSLASEQVPAEMIRDFCEKNRGSGAVWPELTRHLPTVLLTPEEEKAIFSGFPSEGWDRLYAKYPDAYGKITISRVGLSRDKTLAFFYLSVGQAPLLGHGQFHVLKKDGDEWVELPVENLPSWIA